MSSNLTNKKKWYAGGRRLRFMYWIATTARFSLPHFCSSVCLSRQQLLLGVTDKRLWLFLWIEKYICTLLFSWLYPIISVFTKIFSLASNHIWKQKNMNMLWDYGFHQVGRLWSCSGVLAPQKSANVHLKGLHILWSPIVWAEWTCAFSCWAPIICSNETMKVTRWGCWCLSL